MRKHRLLFLSLLVPAFLVLGGRAVVKAQQKTSSTARAKKSTSSDRVKRPSNPIRRTRSVSASIGAKEKGKRPSFRKAGSATS